jgi:hypothetical protein
VTVYAIVPNYLVGVEQKADEAEVVVDGEEVWMVLFEDSE